MVNKVIMEAQSNGPSMATITGIKKELFWFRLSPKTIMEHILITPLFLWTCDCVESVGLLVIKFNGVHVRAG